MKQREQPRPVGPPLGIVCISGGRVDDLHIRRQLGQAGGAFNADDAEAGREPREHHHQAGHLLGRLQGRDDDSGTPEPEFHTVKVDVDRVGIALAGATAITGRRRARR